MRSVILTKSIARKYFGEKDPVGKTIQTGAKEEYVVSGVITDFPVNSSINYDLLFPFEVLVKYKSDQRTNQLFQYFTGIAILVSCIGLFGLATFAAKQRTKEIGIRKVLGASFSDIVVLLSRDFLKLILFAVLIASPVAWYFMNRWLKDFAYKIDINV